MGSGVLPVLVRDGAQRAGDSVLVQEIGGSTETAGEFHRSVMTWADALSRLGLVSGDTVATMLPVSAAAYHAWLGAAWNRSLEVPVNHEYRGSLLCQILNDSRARILVVHRTFLGQIEEVAADLVHVDTVVVVGSSPHEPGIRGLQHIVLEDLLADSTPRERKAPRPSDPLGIIYTSGTTGRPKGVVCSWAQLAEGLDNPFPDDDPGVRRGGAYYCPWMPYHMSGKNGLEHSVGLGIRLVIRPRFSVSQFWDDIRAHGCTHTLLPFIAPWLWRQPEGPADSDNPLQRVCMVPLIPEFREFETRFGVSVSTCWASTEAGFPINTGDPPNHRTCGRARPGFQVRIVDEFDEEVPVGEVGELVVRHDLPWRQCSGYFQNAEATAAAWRNGWFHTGDGFRCDQDGYLYFVERLKEHIKHHGHNISCAEVEHVVCEHDEVIECVCVGVASDLTFDAGPSDEDVRVFVVTESGSTLGEGELYEDLRARLPRFMVPRFIDMVDSLPRNVMNKPARAELRDRPVTASTWDAHAIAPPGDQPGDASESRDG